MARAIRCAGICGRNRPLGDPWPKREESQVKDASLGDVSGRRFGRATDAPLQGGGPFWVVLDFGLLSRPAVGRGHAVSTDFVQPSVFEPKCWRNASATL